MHWWRSRAERVNAALRSGYAAHVRLTGRLQRVCTTRVRLLMVRKTKEVAMDIREYLKKEKVECTTMVHKEAFTAQEVAAAQHVKGKYLN